MRIVELPLVLKGQKLVVGREIRFRVRAAEGELPHIREMFLPTENQSSVACCSGRKAGGALVMYGQEKRGEACRNRKQRNRRIKQKVSFHSLIFIWSLLWSLL
jgi:hypothetical protein